MLEGEEPTHSESEGRCREAKITVLATPEPRDLTGPLPDTDDILAPHSFALWGAKTGSVRSQGANAAEMILGS